MYETLLLIYDTLLQVEPKMRIEAQSSIILAAMLAIDATSGFVLWPGLANWLGGGGINSHHQPRTFLDSISIPVIRWNRSPLFGFTKHASLKFGRTDQHEDQLNRVEGGVSIQYGPDLQDFKSSVPEVSAKQKTNQIEDSTQQFHKTDDSYKDEAHWYDFNGQ